MNLVARLVPTVAACLCACLPLPSLAGGLFDLDHRVALDERGIWSRSSQLAIQYGVIATEVGGALWLGRDDPLGDTLWRSVDASVASAVAAQGLKWLGGRERPADTADANAWHRGRVNQSFPSGEVTLQGAFVTPLIVHFADAYPAVWALEVLPLYDAVARVKSRAHWQSDVLAGWALGTGVGYWTATRAASPLSVQILPDGVTVSWRRAF